VGAIVSYASNGSEGHGYLALPAAPSPAVIVVHEWWGLVDQLKRTCDRYAEAGFVALAPDLYRGAATDDPDEASRRMLGLDPLKATGELAAAVDHLLSHEATSSSRVGVTGFCMGGGLALLLACQRPDAVGAIVTYYAAIPWPGHQPDYPSLTAAVQGHYAEKDAVAPPSMVVELETTLRGLGKRVELFIYPGTDRGFFNEDRHSAHHPAAARQAWERTLGFLRANVR
jgi:carboxymethylenebutenolidase